MLRDDLEGWEGRRKEGLKRERIYVYLWLIRVVLWQKPTQPCKSLKKKVKKKESKKKITTF